MRTKAHKMQGDFYKKIKIVHKNNKLTHLKNKKTLLQ